MKRITALMSLSLVLFLAVQACAQKSPKAEAEGTIGAAKVEIVYHQPSARGRTMIGGKNVPYGEVWRTGANNATTIEFNQDVSIEGEKLAKGKYALFTIPGEQEWTIIFNKEFDQWGAFKYKESEDALRVKVKADKPAEFVETFVIAVEGDGVVLTWENSKVKFGVK